MDSEVLKQLLKERHKGEGRRKELKVYIAHIVGENPLNIKGRDFKATLSQDGSESGFYNFGDLKFYYEEYKNMALFFTAEPSEKTKIIKDFIRKNRALKKPWIEGYVFKNEIQNQIASIGEIRGYSAIFEPYKEYTDYGCTLRIWGRKSDEFLKHIKGEYLITPKRIKADLVDNGKKTLSFRISNDGQFSYIKGHLDLFLHLLYYYINILKENLQNYEAEPIKEEMVSDGIILEFKERFVINFNSQKEGNPNPNIPHSLNEDEKKALLELITTGGKKYGFFGYLVGENKANIIDLEEKKMLFVTLFDNKMSVIARNPTHPTESLKRLHKTIVEHIYPYTHVDIESIRIG